MDFRDYLAAAREKTGLKNNHQVALKLGMSNGIMSMYTSGQRSPSQETVLEIAKLAGIPEEVAVVDWARWNDKSGKKRAFWNKLRAAAAALNLALLMALLLALTPTDAHAYSGQVASNGQNVAKSLISLYIMRHLSVADGRLEPFIKPRDFQLCSPFIPIRRRSASALSTSTNKSMSYGFWNTCGMAVRNSVDDSQ